MHYENEASVIRREVLTRVARAYLAGRLLGIADRIPFEMRPKSTTATRCCVYQDREIIRHRCLAAMGIGVEEEVDELTPLSTYASRALARPTITPPILTVIDVACESCVQAHYQVTDACRGCMARPCTHGCPKQAILVLERQARIDQKLCVNCGKCQKVCPYHAIVRIPVPCEEACPVGAIGKGEDGKEHINYDTCIFCGQCMSACPFGAIAEKSHGLDVLRALAAGQQVVAMFAPAAVGQFGGDLLRLIAALKRFGFAEVIEVARGADWVATEEAAEFCRRMQAGERLMTCSCCPAYVEAARKHVPALVQCISQTPTPMHATAELVRKQLPDAVTVFIGPCVAKRKEALDDPLVDYALTFEEMGALFAAKDIVVADCAPAALPNPAHREGRGFAITGGVGAAVQSVVQALAAAGGTPPEVRLALLNGLTRQGLKLLNTYAAGECPGNLLEVMACEGGCVGGPGVLGNPVSAARKVEQLSRASTPLGTSQAPPPPAAQ